MSCHIHPTSLCGEPTNARHPVSERLLLFAEYHVLFSPPNLFMSLSLGSIESCMCAWCIYLNGQRYVSVSHMHLMLLSYKWEKKEYDSRPGQASSLRMLLVISAGYGFHLVEWTLRFISY